MEDETITLQAEKHKNKGNDAFKTGNYQAAIECYTAALELCPNECAFYTNRAITYLKMETPELAMNDCQRAL
jgi:tetratricopeptide (TPR) repeat protein